VTRTTTFTLTVVLTVATQTQSSTPVATFYIAPNGSDSNPGTSSQPWKTWGHALNKATLLRGMTLVAKDGEYLTSVNGTFRANCSDGGNANNGTPTAPITVKAENERQAYIHGDISEIVGVVQCSYWVLDGFRVEQETVGPDEDFQVWILGGPNSTIRRFLFNRNNLNDSGSHLLRIAGNNNLIEENEFYNWHRHGVILQNNNTGNVIRRNYANQKDRNGGVTSCFTNYPGSDNIFENNICESPNTNNALIGFENQDISARNKFFGNITIGTNVSWSTTYKTPFGDGYPLDIYAENHVAVNSRNTAFTTHSVGSATECRNCSNIGNNRDRGFVGQGYDGNSPATMTLKLTNSLALNGGGFTVLGLNIWAYNYVNAYNCGNACFYPSSGPSLTHATTVNPGLGSCKVWIPAGSPMKGAGLGGADIGANILYRYQNGTVTKEPLWDPITGEFPHGAIITGVNDVAGKSAFDVHSRLNVNTNGCSFPAGYGN
jgi:hypothetical protein